MKDSKKLASLLVEKTLKAEGPMEKETPEMEDPKLMMVDELMSALKDGDKETFLESFKSLMEMCKEDSEDY